MALRLENQWVWDFWTIAEGGTHHLFYLQAPRQLEDCEDRHWNVSIGHAVSDDLEDWVVLPDALAPGPPGAWDDFTTWTGSVVAIDDGWAMLYTGTNHAETGRIQRIGLATSADLITWSKHAGNPVLVTDASRYEEYQPDIWHDQAWRDPSVVLDDDGVFHCFLTARVPIGDTLTRGVLAHAISDDLVHWKTGDPVVGPGDFGHLEIPQVIRVGDRWHLLYSVPGSVVASHRPGLTATYQVVADDILGPYREPSQPIVIEHPDWYGAKLVDTPDGLKCLAWRNLFSDGTFAGEIGPPWPVEVADDGSLSVEGP